MKFPFIYHALKYRMLRKQEMGGGITKWQHQSSSIINAFLLIAYFWAASEKSAHKHSQTSTKESIWQWESKLWFVKRTVAGIRLAIQQYLYYFSKTLTRIAYQTIFFLFLQ